MTETGIVKWFNPKKGYGFIIRDQAPSKEIKEIFVHYSSINKNGFKSLNPGDKVKFIVKSGKKPGSIEAHDVCIITSSKSRYTATLSDDNRSKTDNTSGKSKQASKLAGIPSFKQDNPIEVQVIQDMINKSRKDMGLTPKKSSETADKHDKEDSQPDITNLKIVESAKKEYEKENYLAAAELFRRSKIICEKQSWVDGVRYADEMIEECKKKANF
ncbi:MAG: hypothetical protein GF364_17510 [Candidatus Lokiarchaeota archaeon]|nr:hypothetical protein [Candidatus Lokiarchaeota archaeon]